VLEQLTQALKKDHKSEDTSLEMGGGGARNSFNKGDTRNKGEYSAPSSAWDAHRNKSPPYVIT